MRKLILVFLFLSTACFGQYILQAVTFDDTTTSALFGTDVRDVYLAGIAKPDSGGNILTFDVEISSTGTDAYALLTAAGTAAYSVTLPDSTNAYCLSLPKDVFDPWRYFRIKFAKATTCTLTVMWRRK